MNWNLLGHDWAVDLLREHVAQGGVRHAYLFTGPQGVGRRTLALRLAQAVNCSNPPAPGEVCGACSNCSRIERMQHPDLAIVQAEQVGGVLKVEQVREIQHMLSLAPYEARYRIALILRFEEAHAGAANALLKTLEEPPPQVVLLLTAESIESLLPTIVSRCEVLRLRPLPVEAVSQGLQIRNGLDATRASLLAHISGGRPGYALRLSEEPELLEERRTRLGDLWVLLGSNSLERFSYAKAIKEDKEALRGTLQTWSSFWRDVLLKSTGADTPLTNLDWADEIEQMTSQVNPETAHFMLSSLQRTLYLLDRNINPRLAIEVLLLDLPRLQVTFSA
jgi:DNA polymerase III subunit delta'